MNLYIREGRNGNGSDWTNAFGQVPALVRGNTYYVADGTYNGFTSSVSGTTPIVIKKATAADHGTDTGWNNSYGDGQAVFGDITLNDMGYFTLDGNGVEYGIKINHPNDDGGKAFFVGGWAAMDINNITLSYVEMAGPAGVAGYAFKNYTDGVWAFRFGTTPWVLRNWKIAHCSIHGFAEDLHTYKAVDWVVEYNKIYDNNVTPTSADLHPNLWYNQDSHNLIFRYNEVWNWNVTGLYTFYGTTGDMRVYGNYFHDAGGKALWFYESGSWEQVHVYNNTFADVFWATSAHGSQTFGASDFRNNLFSNSVVELAAGWSHDYNWYSGSDKKGEANGVAGGNTNPWSTKPQISSSVSSTLPKDKGVALAAPYNVDPKGVTRGADGKWDIGAYESGSNPNPPNPPIDPPVEGTWVSGSSWTNVGVAKQTGAFTWSFRAKASSAAADGVVGLSPVVSKGFNDLGPIVRFGPGGSFDAINGGGYAALAEVKYVAGVEYEIVASIDVGTRTYGVTVDGIKIADGYAFRSAQSAATELDNMGISVPASGTVTVSAMVFEQGNTPPPEVVYAHTISEIEGLQEALDGKADKAQRRK